MLALTHAQTTSAVTALRRDPHVDESCETLRDYTVRLAESQLDILSGLKRACQLQQMH